MTIPGRDTPDPQNITTLVPAQERTAELQSFMLAVRYQSSGSYRGEYGGTGGAYGIDASRWDTMSRRAGLTNAEFRDPGMQDYVAAWTMKMLYGKYRNWSLVALAWSEGEGAAAAVIKQSGRAPQSVTIDDIKSFMPEATFVDGVSASMAKQGFKGITEETISLADASRRPTQVITGTARVGIEDTYNATVRQLWQEAEDEKSKGLPSATNSLYSQLEAWSSSVAGGSRADYRTDTTAMESEKGMVDGPGGANELPAMEVEQS